MSTRLCWGSRRPRSGSRSRDADLPRHGGGAGLVRVRPSLGGRAHRGRGTGGAPRAAGRRSVRRRSRRAHGRAVRHARMGAAGPRCVVAERRGRRRERVHRRVRRPRQVRRRARRVHVPVAAADAGARRRACVALAVPPPRASDADAVSRALVGRDPRARPASCDGMHRGGRDTADHRAKRRRSVDARPRRGERGAARDRRQPCGRRRKRRLGPRRADANRRGRRPPHAARSKRSRIPEPSGVARARRARRSRAWPRRRAVAVAVHAGRRRTRSRNRDLHGGGASPILAIRSDARGGDGRRARASAGRRRRGIVRGRSAVLLAGAGRSLAHTAFVPVRPDGSCSMSVITAGAHAEEADGADNIRVFDSDAAPADEIALEALRQGVAGIDLAAPAVALPDFHFKDDKEMPSSMAIATRDTIRPTMTCSSLNCGMTLVALDNDRPGPDAIRDFYDRVRTRLPFPPTYRPDLTADEVVRCATDGAGFAVDRFGVDPAALERMEVGGRIDTEAYGGADRIRRELPWTIKQLSRIRFATIGPSNHFVELQQVEEVFDAEAASLLGVEAGQMTLQFHGGGGALTGELGVLFGRRKRYPKALRVQMALQKPLYHLASARSLRELRRRWELYFTGGFPPI